MVTRPEQRSFGSILKTPTLIGRDSRPESNTAWGVVKTKKRQSQPTSWGQSQLPRSDQIGAGSGGSLFHSQPFIMNPVTLFPSFCLTTLSSIIIVVDHFTVAHPNHSHYTTSHQSTCLSQHRKSFPVHLTRPSLTLGVQRYLQDHSCHCPPTSGCLP